MSGTITYLEFRAIGGDPAKVKLYAVGGIEDGIIDDDDSPLQEVDSESDESGRWRGAFIDLPVGDYQLIAFSAGDAIVADERYTVTNDNIGSNVQPWSEAKPLTVAEIAAGVAAASVNVLPAVGIVANRAPGATLTPVVGETISQAITLYQTDGTTPVSLAGKTLAIVFETVKGTDVAVVANANIAVSGANSNIVTFAYPSAVTASERILRFAIRDDAAPLTMYLQGLCAVGRAPQVDA